MDTNHGFKARPFPEDKIEGISPALHLAIQTYNARAQFHDAHLLSKIIEAVREEERYNFKYLVSCAKAIVDNMPIEKKS